MFGAGRKTRKSLVAAGAALAFLGFLLCLVLVLSDWRSLSSPADTSYVVRDEAKPDAKRPDSADVRIALLCDYYEHGIEHAPPRDPSGCMQRREQHYTAPRNPFVLAGKLLGQSPSDEQIRLWMRQRESEYVGGNPASESELKALEVILPGTSLNSLALLEIGRAFNYLEGDALAACWYRVGLAKAEVEYKDTAPGSPSAAPLLHALDQTKALWRLRDYPTMEKRFALAMRLNLPLSPEARRAGYLHAEMVYYQNRLAEAADAILAVQAQHERAGDLGALENSDVSEMHWILGVMLYCDERYTQAIPHWEAVIARGDDARRQQALLSLCVSLAKTDRPADAISRYEQWLSHGRPDVSEAASVLLAIDAARLRARQR